MVKGVCLALDVGERRIGVAKSSPGVTIAVPLGVVVVDGNEVEAIAHLVKVENASTVVIGYPRNQQGQPTAQTAIVEGFVSRLKKGVPAEFVYQDESLTSVHAEAQLKASQKAFNKGDIDAVAASIILQDYLELNRGRF